MRLPHKKLWPSLLAALALVAAGSAQASTHALLVGVSGYPNLPKTYRLEGPGNDVTRMAQVLRRRGVQDITVLADGVPGSAGDPTLSAIRSQFALLSNKVAPGDWTIVYFSGHGSQQPQPAQIPADEPREHDGMDELFLPYDVARWDAQAGRVSNSLIDDEIGRALRGLLQRGSSVWAVFDACNAGDMDKSLPLDRPGLRRSWRYVPSSVLGIPEALQGKTLPHALGGRIGTGDQRAVAEDTMPLPPAHPISKDIELNGERSPASAPGRTSGQLVAFYAAESNEPAAEEALLPSGGSSRMVGVFTWYLSQALAARGPAGPQSFRDLMESVRRRFRADHRAFPNPGAQGPVDLQLPF